MIFTTIRKGTQLLTSKGKPPKAWLDSHKDFLPLEVYLELRGGDFRLYDAKDTWEATLTRLEADREDAVVPCVITTKCDLGPLSLILSSLFFFFSPIPFSMFSSNP